VERLPGARPVVVSMVLVVLAATTACSASKTTSTALPTAAAASVFTEALAKARAADPAVSVAQLKALEKAAKSGEMPYEEISALLDDTFTCFDDSGVAYQRLPDEEQIPGFKVPSFGVGEPVAVADGCLGKFSQYAENAYQTQPKAAELRVAAFQAERTQVLACLRKKGAILDDNATYDEMAQARDSLLLKAIKEGVGWEDCSKYWW
jgi:hypothetical protein